MYFLILATDYADKIQLRKKIRPSHRDYLRKPIGHNVTVHLGGPTLNADNSSMNGTLLVVETNSIEQVKAFIADDPYSKAGLFDSVEVRPWSWSLGNPQEDNQIEVAS
jgi:uncharacterized protein YciI